MYFVYLTSKNYPGRTADHGFVKKQAESLVKVLGLDFVLVASGLVEGDLSRNIKSPFLKIRRGKILFYFFWSLFFYFSIKRKDKNILFFSNDAYLLSILIWWRKFLGFKYKIVSDWHQLFKDWRDKYMALNSDYLITTTRVLKNRLVNDFKIDDKKVLVSYGGVDLDLFKVVPDDKNILRGELNLPLNKKLIGYVGYFKTMGMDKGVGDIIEALKFLDENFKAVLVGGKEIEQEEYKKMAQDFGVLNRCIFVDRQEESNLIKYEKAMDILVIPYPNREHFRQWGFPMKTYEYMASGVPIIYSNLNILDEVLNGLAVSYEAENVKDLAYKIKGINIDSLKLSQKAQDVIKNYTWNERVKNIINFISK